MDTREDIYGLLSKLLVDMFEVEKSSITMTSDLYEDLDVDSIDAVDLVVELRAITGKQIDPDEFKAVRTVEDVVNAVAAILEIK